MKNTGTGLSVGSGWGRRMAHVVLASLLFATFIVWNYILVNIREKENLQFESEA